MRQPRLQFYIGECLPDFGEAGIQKNGNTKTNEANKMTLWHKSAGKGLVDVPSKVDFPALEHTILDFWKEHNIFRRTIDEREGCPDYVAYDGPPGTNGKPHIGNIMQSALKDLWPRYYTMKGYHVLRKAGWDTHGLPIEQTAERELGLSTKQDIIEYGVEKYIDYCRKTVFRYKDAWGDAIHRIGRFLDTDDYYATMQKEYVQTDWWVLKQAWKKDILYQGHKILPYSPLGGMTLSSHEVAQGYKDITDISLFVKFPVIGQDKTFLVAWTTTAWTLLSNVALAINPKLQYVTVETNGERLILAEDRLEAVKDKLGEFKVIDRKLGAKLKCTKYSPLWDFLNGVGDNAHVVVADEYVTAEDGSGMVHLALYGEDDFRLINKNNLPMVQNVDVTGHCTDNTGVYAGRYFRDEGDEAAKRDPLDVSIIKDLAGKGLLLGKQRIVHSYPHNYKSGEPLMYFAKSAWFLRTSALKEQMLAANEKINWYPEHIKAGRFGNWLENNVDWAITRERFWGTPLPIWTCEKDECKHRECVGSLEELGELRGEPLPDDFDPHKPQIDKITLPCKKCGGTMYREPEVLDCWFDAGIMPWGQWGYPVKAGSEELLKRQLPGDFICEAIDQTRGWFYTMLAPAVMLTNESSYKNVICTELILDEHGQKMSKSRKESMVDPIELCDQYGADAVRWNFYGINPWTVRKFKRSDIPDVLKQVIIPYWNAYSFFVTYARVDSWSPSKDAKLSDKLLDRWIMSRLEEVRQSVEDGLDSYDVTSAANAITAFIDELTNWYIRRSRRRFWKSEDDNDKQAAYQTLHHVLVHLNRILAPFLPFVTEVIYQNLERGFDVDADDSIHLTRWMPAGAVKRDVELESSMKMVRDIVTMARSLRNEGDIRVRQPLPEIVIATDGSELSKELSELILDELNVKKISYTTNSESLYSYQAKADFKALGPKFGKKVNEVAAFVSKLDDAAIRKLIGGDSISFDGRDISKDELVLTQIPAEGYWVKSEGGLTVAVDHRIDDELYSEWMAREFVHTVQNMRKDANLNVTQRITIEVSTSLWKIVENNQDYIKNETLAVELLQNDKIASDTEHSVGDKSGKIQMRLS